MNPTDKSTLTDYANNMAVRDDTVARALEELPQMERLVVFAEHQGDLSAFLTEDRLSAIAARCREDYDTDCNDREEWMEVAETSLKRAKQEKEEEKMWPWAGASNASFPLLTTASLQFAARAYPAIVKGDEVVSCKVVGSDSGMPAIGPDGQPMVQPGPDGQPMPMWQIPPGAKASRAKRVADYLNYTVFYHLKGWEEDTDTLLHHLPIIGCGFRKIWVDGDQMHAEYVPAMKLVAPMCAKSCEESTRLTEVQEGLRLNDIIGLQRTGFYRPVTLVESEEQSGLRTLLEQHCLIDLDDDGYAEPYVVTLDEESGQLLRIEANFSTDDVMIQQQEVEADGIVSMQPVVVKIRRECYYVKYDFFPSLDGGFYGLGLGHLLENISTIVNNTINQMIDAGTAQAAGGGFIGSGVDLNGGGKRKRIDFEPGVYKTITASGTALREAIYERTFPGPNPVTFQVLELMLGAARDISSVKDVLTGEARNTGQVGTTLALIEQGLQVFTAIYKRIHRSLKEEFSKLYLNVSRYGGEQAAQEYLTVLDELADFQQDFSTQDYDIRPVSDPTNVTKMQRMAKAQFLGSFMGTPGINTQEIQKRIFEAADIEDIDKLFMPPPQPDPMQMAAAEAEIAGKVAVANKDTAAAEKYRVEAAAKMNEESRKDAEARLRALAEGFQIGASQ